MQRIPVRPAVSLFGYKFFRRVARNQSFLLLFSIFLLVPCTAAPDSHPESHLIIPKGATIEQIFQIFNNTTAVPCIAQKPSSARRTEREFTGNFSEALKFTASTFDFHVATRPDVILLYSQYSLPEDYPALPTQELESVSNNLYRLIHSIRTPAIGGSSNADRNALISSFTTEQTQLLQGKGLPVTSLSPMQGKLWRAVNSSFLYDDADDRLSKLIEFLGHWKQCELISVQYQPSDKGWLLRFPDPKGASGFRQIAVPMVTGDLPQVRMHRFDTIVVRTRHCRLSTRLDRKIDIPSGDVTLGELFDLVRSSTGFYFRLPTHAMKRPFIVSGRAMSARALVDSLTEMNGWSCDVDAKGHYVLERPRFGAARTAHELYEAQQGIIPPSLAFLCTQSSGSAIAWERGQMDAVSRSYSPTTLSSGVRISELSPIDQERVAQALALDLLHPLFSGNAVLSPNSPPAFALTPERGILQMGGSGPALRNNTNGIAAQSLSVTVPRATGGADRWGWIIGSARSSR